VTVRKYTELIAGQKAIDFVEAVYLASEQFPRSEVYGLTSQIRRAVISVPSNIAEAQGRTTSREFVRFLSISEGSLNEVETQLIIAQRLNYIEAGRLEELLERSVEVMRLVKALSKSIERRIAQTTNHSSLTTNH
jgi:four helix bundle protein